MYKRQVYTIIGISVHIPEGKARRPPRVINGRRALYYSSAQRAQEERIRRVLEVCLIFLVEDYGRERGLTLADALKAAAETDVQRIRLGSLDPDEISQDLINACAAEEKFCRQFHLSLQSGCDKTLHRMARRYTTAQFADTVARIRAAMPDAVFTTDVMCGFVGETEEDHRASLAFCENIGFYKQMCIRDRPWPMAWIKRAPAKFWCMTWAAARSTFR